MRRISFKNVKNIKNVLKVSAAALMGVGAMSVCGCSMAMMSPEDVKDENNRVNASMINLVETHPNLVWRDINPNDARPVDPDIVARYFATRLTPIEDFFAQIGL